ncbi:MAG: hypothetical protein U0U70_10800 [Chitinophagaceae bacterium]
MVTLRNFISAFWALLFLTQCNTKQDSNSTTEIVASSAKTQSENPLTGEWKYINSIWYSSELTLRDNGTFKFHDQGCYGQKFSQGQWSNNNNGTILLTSFDTFKEKEQSETIKSTEVADQRKTKRKLKKGEVEIVFTGFKDVPPPVLPGPNDTVRIYLNKVQLRLNNDTLYCVGSDKLLEGAKFYRTKNNR